MRARCASPFFYFCPLVSQFALISFPFLSPSFSFFLSFFPFFLFLASCHFLFSFVFFPLLIFFHPSLLSFLWFSAYLCSSIFPSLLRFFLSSRVLPSPRFTFLSVLLFFSICFFTSEMIRCVLKDINKRVWGRFWHCIGEISSWGQL